MTNRLTTPGIALATLLLVGCSDSITEPQDQWETVRSATAVYQNIDAARAAGYTVWSPDPSAPNSTCASSPEGRMGYHLVNTALRGSPSDPAAADAVIDPHRPEMLLYEKLPNGTMNLVGVEYLVFTAAWERVHGVGAAPPTVFGERLPPSRHNFTPGGPEIDHYEVHVWLHKHNPLGMFAPWHPNVSC
jgi:hypothetical protein